MENEREQLISLWESSFGDEREYIEQFFAAYKDRMRIKTLSVHSKVVCSCYLLPAFISAGNGTEKEIWYLYALSTCEEEKGKGYAGRLLKQIEEDYFLVPSQGLEEFYERRGLKRWLVQETKEVEASLCEEAEFCVVSSMDIVAEYEAKRNKTMMSEGYIRWDIHALEYALMEHEFCGGKILKWNKGGDTIFGLISLMETGEVLIKEITEEFSKWEEFAAMAAGFFRANKAVIPGRTVMIPAHMNGTTGQGYFGLSLG